MIQSIEHARYFVQLITRYLIPADLIVYSTFDFNICEMMITLFAHDSDRKFYFTVKIQNPV